MKARNEILVVDDEPGYRALIGKKLRAAGHHTILAQNAEEALVALWKKENIGLVLLDVRLPVISGLNIFPIIRRDFPDKRIIVTSALQYNEQQFLIEDADDYYYKFEDLSILIKKIDNVLNHSSMKGRSRQDEKRNFKRMPVNVLASFERDNHNMDSAGTHFLSYTKDLSPWGGRFIVDREIKVGQHFSVSLEIPVNFLPLLIDCEVVWVKELEEVGVRFVKLDSPRDEEKLKNYLNRV